MECENCKVLQAKIDELERQLKTLSVNCASKAQELKKIERTKSAFVSVKEEKQAPQGSFLAALDKLRKK